MDKNEFLANKEVLEYALYKAINQEPFTHFIEPKAVKGLLEEYQEDNDYLLSWVKHEYMEKGWHELDVVPVFIVTRSLKHYAEDMGIPKPNVYGAGKETIKHLQQLTPNRYSLRKKRVSPEDFEKLEAWDVDKIKMRTPQHSITKQE